MKPGDLTDHQFLTILREQAGLEETIQSLEFSRNDLLASFPASAKSFVDARLMTIDKELVECREALSIVSTHIYEHDRAVSAPEDTQPRWKKIGNLAYLGSPIYAETKTVNPPAVAEAFTRLITKPKLVERVLGSRAERFQRHVKERGLRTAQLFYCADTAASAWPALKQLFRWALVGDILRRFLGS